MMSIPLRILLLLVCVVVSFGFKVHAPPRIQDVPLKASRSFSPTHQLSSGLEPGARCHHEVQSRLSAALDVETIGLVVGQENYGLAIVSLGEALWSFSQAPSLSQAKVVLPGVVAAIILVVLSGPMVTSGDAASIGTGLGIATAVSIALGASYIARLAAPYSASSKEIAALGLLLTVAGFFSFSQNLVVNGFITLPDIPLPSLPMPQGDGGVDYDAMMSMKDEIS